MKSDLLFFSNHAFTSLWFDIQSSSHQICLKLWSHMGGWSYVFVRGRLALSGLGPTFRSMGSIIQSASHSLGSNGAVVQWARSTLGSNRAVIRWTGLAPGPHWVTLWSSHFTWRVRILYRRFIHVTKRSRNARWRYIRTSLVGKRYFRLIVRQRHLGWTGRLSGVRIPPQPRHLAN